MAENRRRAAGLASAAIARERNSIARIREVRPGEVEAEWTRRLGELRPEEASGHELWAELKPGARQ